MKIFYKKGGKKIAKIKGPLFSFEGSGKLGKTLVYRERKKVKDVKKYVVPYNPKTEDQGKQRDYLKDAVLHWKTDGYSNIDYLAWDMYASIKKKNLSGYNMFIREWINATKESKTWTKLTSCLVYEIYPIRADLMIDIESDKNGILYLGTSKYSMLREEVGIFYEGKYYFTLMDIKRDTRYYFCIKNTSENERARTGIYTFKTIS